MFLTSFISSKIHCQKVAAFSYFSPHLFKTQDANHLIIAKFIIKAPTGDYIQQQEKLKPVLKSKISTYYHVVFPDWFFARVFILVIERSHLFCIRN